MIFLYFSISYISEIMQIIIPLVVSSKMHTFK